MNNVVNLRLARKAKARIDKARLAEENRIRHGRPKAERLEEAARKEKAANLLDGVFRKTRIEKDDEI